LELESELELDAELELELDACAELPEDPGVDPVCWAIDSGHSAAHKSPMAGKAHPMRANDFRAGIVFCMILLMIFCKVQGLKIILLEFLHFQFMIWKVAC